MTRQEEERKGEREKARKRESVDEKAKERNK